MWSWDITYLRFAITGQFFYLYMILDVWSRKIMAATVFSKECGQNSALLFVEAFHRHRVDPKGLVLHSDNGGPMKGSTMLATLQRLGVVPLLQSARRQQRQSLLGVAVPNFEVPAGISFPPIQI